MDKNLLGVIRSTDLIDAKLEEHQMCGSTQCPSCGHRLENKPDWLGLPAGVKFDPTDQELIEHLEAKVEGQDSKSHPLIDEFIPTIQGEDGICYTHPEKLPGVTRDGLSRHFFHRPSKAYTTGTRKRRKIQTECDLQGGETRWHKTGKTRPVMVNGMKKGCKKILVLYTNFGKHKKPEKTNWVMHQYHLGQLEEEREGELVVSKIFYQTQPRQCSWSERSSSTGENIGSEKQREVSGSIKSCSSNEGREIEDLSGAGTSSYSPMDVQQLKSDNFSFAPFTKSFDEVGIGEGTQTTEGSNRCNPGMCEKHEEHEQQIGASPSTQTAATTRPPLHMTHATHDQRQHHHHQQQQVATAAFHISRPSNPISTIIAPPLHQTTMVLNDPAFQVSRLLLQTEKFQQQQQEQKLVDRSGSASHKLSSLEELFMNCASSDIKEVQEAEWMKYTFWPDPDNPDHHG